jgi:thioredoxin-like negative regulator of GroEL
MLRQFNRFLVLALLVGGALYITLTNSDNATIRLGPNLTLTTYAGVIYIAVFAIGCVAASLVALFFGLKGYLRERKLRAAERAREGFYKTFERARNLMASGDWAAARDLWEQIIHRDEENVMARVELSRCLEALNDPREALRVLDATRASSRASSEVLFRAAELNRKLGNKTAASDNLGLILTEAPSRKALELARDINEELGRIGDAIEFQNELEKIGYTSEDADGARRRLTFAQIVSESQGDTVLRDALSGFVKRNPAFVPALEKLASLEVARGDVESSAELLVKAAKAAKGDVSKWQAVVDLWLHATQGEFTRRAERAIAAARSASQDTSGRSRLEAELLLIRTLLATNRFEDAERLIDSFPSLAERALKNFPKDIHAQWVIQKGHCLAQIGKARDTAPLWEQLAVSGQPRGTTQPAKTLREKQTEPSPALSTP